MDINLYLQYTAKKRDLRLPEQLQYFGSDSDHDRSENANKPCKKIRRFKSKCPFYIDESGNYHEIEPTKTFWYLVYVRNPHLNNAKFVNKFRQCF